MLSTYPRGDNLRNLASQLHASITTQCFALWRFFCPGDASGEEDALGDGSDDEDGGDELTEVRIHRETIALGSLLLWCVWLRNACTLHYCRIRPAEGDAARFCACREPATDSPQVIGAYS